MNVLDNSSVFFSSIKLPFLSDGIFGVISCAKNNNSGSSKGQKGPPKPKAGNGHRTTRDYAITRTKNNGGAGGNSNGGLPKNSKAWWQKFSS